MTRRPAPVDFDDNPDPAAVARLLEAFNDNLDRAMTEADQKAAGPVPARTERTES